MRTELSRLCALLRFPADVTKREAAAATQKRPEEVVRAEREVQPGPCTFTGILKVAGSQEFVRSGPGTGDMKVSDIAEMLQSKLKSSPFDLPMTQVPNSLVAITRLVCNIR